MVYVVAGPDGENIMFGTKKEADAYIAKYNEPQENYDANRASHTAADEALDAWAQKAEKLRSKWSDPQVKQDLMQELASIKFGKDKGFMLSNPTSRFNIAYDAFIQTEYRSKTTNGADCCYKNGKIVAEPTKGETEAEGSFYDWSYKLDTVPMDFITTMKVFGFDGAYRVDDVRIGIDHMKGMPDMFAKYKEIVKREFLSEKFPSKNRLETLSMIASRGLNTFMGEALTDYFLEHGGRPMLKKTLDSDLSNKGDVLEMIAGALPNLSEIADEKTRMRAGYDAELMLIDKNFNLKPQKDDDFSMIKSKVQTLTVMSTKGYPAAQKMLADYYTEQKDYKNADRQLRRLEYNEIAGEKYQELASEQRKEVRRKSMEQTLQNAGGEHVRGQHKEEKKQQMSSPRRPMPNVR